MVALQKRFVEAAVEFKENRENIIKVTNPTLQQLHVLLELWSTRQIKTEKFILTLELQDCKLELDKIKNMF